MALPTAKQYRVSHYEFREYSIVDSIFPAIQIRENNHKVFSGNNVTKSIAIMTYHYVGKPAVAVLVYRHSSLIKTNVTLRDVVTE